MLRQVFGSSDQGLVRTANQDCFITGTIRGCIRFAVLCDGMGGENGGNVAAKIASEFAEKVLLRDISREMTELSIRAVFSSIFSGANALVHDAAQKDPSLKGMGTTMIIAVLKEEILYIGSVGDSRLYIAGPARQVQITKDHTIVQMMVDNGEITPDDALVHPKRHFITRAVGVADSVEMDYYVEELAEEDLVLLCSDGFYNYLAPGELLPLLEEAKRTQSAEHLVVHANAGGGADNITAVVMA